MRDNHLPLFLEPAEGHRLTYLAHANQAPRFWNSYAAGRTRLGQLDGLGGGVMRPTWPGK